MPSPQHPVAKTGYGKRFAGDEDPHADPDFAHLSPRDREIAVFVDHLEDGHAMGYKSIAAVHPRYGQQAVRTSLGRITLAGHLRWIKEHITVEDNSMRWVTRTYWSRTRRSEEWWADFARERHGKDVTEDHMPGLARAEQEQEQAEEPTAEPVPDEQPAEQPADQPSTAYQTLAELRAADARMPLSDRDCRSLESLANEWMSRGATPRDITKALTDGLPPDVTNPGGFARNRLENKMPPKKAKVRQKAARRARVTRVITACGLCDADERTTEIVSGLCRECLAEIEAEGLGYGPVPDTFLPGPRDGGGLPGADEVIDVTERVDALRRAAGLL
ncbi:MULTISPECIES: hypothetical protein [unclassified Streptomyces]|uniref:hypothetical protein n=1 Tax=unclassified Streptomyces TaxID=2593676 RepID=UPI002366CD32|nr:MULTISPECIES: hypothetical protein [unclassified Streptomyces]MDF3141442.1 hypothetical protein [Streptomyces sp. T21Q-yed]WDF40095.1 hypothetical protein PBV52_26580 [Streptomyces sp. T12]